MAITEQDVRHVAKLAAIELSDAEVSKLSGQLADLFQYIDKLESVIIRGVSPTWHVHGATNFFRDDLIKDSLPVETVRELAPEFAVGGYQVPRIIG